MEVTIELAHVELLFTAQPPVDLVEVTLDHLRSGNLLELGGRGPVVPRDVARGLALAVPADHLDVLPAKLAAQFVEIERDGEPGAVAHEQAVVAIVDVSSRSGNEDAALVLQALAFPVIAVPDELAVGQPSGQHQQHRGEQRLKEHEAGALRSVGFDDAQGEESPTGRIGRGRASHDGARPENGKIAGDAATFSRTCLLYTSPSPRDRTRS